MPHLLVLAIIGPLSKMQFFVVVVFLFNLQILNVFKPFSFYLHMVYVCYHTAIWYLVLVFVLSFALFLPFYCLTEYGTARFLVYTMKLKVFYSIYMQSE